MKPIGGTKQNNSNLSKLIDKFHKACTNGNIEYVREVLRSEFRDQVIDSINSEVKFSFFDIEYFSKFIWYEFSYKLLHFEEAYLTDKQKLSRFWFEIMLIQKS